jgi:hypothetical protein
MQASELAATQQHLREHVEHIFSLPAWLASPRQTELLEALHALETQSAEVIWQQHTERCSAALPQIDAFHLLAL